RAATATGERRRHRGAARLGPGAGAPGAAALLVARRARADDVPVLGDRRRVLGHVALTVREPRPDGDEVQVNVHRAADAPIGAGALEELRRARALEGEVAVGRVDGRL